VKKRREKVHVLMVTKMAGMQHAMNAFVFVGYKGEGDPTG
jgi:hypothetical protein